MDSEPDRCGIFPLAFGGWAAPACKWHDQAYIKGSSQQESLTREQIDKQFYLQLKELAERGRFKLGKLIMASVMYRVVRLFGGNWWEGER